VKFAVIRHPEVAPAGITPEDAYPHWRALGWFRVSDWRGGGDEFNLAEFTAGEDLDPEPEPPAAPADEQQPEPDPARPVTAEETE
jgi:hypothetical protein